MSPWVRLDDHFDDDPRVATVGPSGAGLLTMLLAYSNRTLADGFVSANTVRQKAAALDDPNAVVTLMVRVGLLQPAERDGIPGFNIHADFVQLQPTREQVEAERQARKVRKERWKERHRNADGTADGTRTEQRGNGSGTHRPDPDPDPGSRSTTSENSVGVRKGGGAGGGEPQKRHPLSVAEMQTEVERWGTRKAGGLR